MSLRRCPHGVEVGPLDDHGLPADQEVADYSVYCWVCNGLAGPEPAYPEPEQSPSDVGDPLRREGGSASSPELPATVDQTRGP